MKLSINRFSENFDLDMKVINNIRALSIDMINSAQSGHPGIALGAAPIIYRLYNKHLIFDPCDPSFINRDRFVMSCGHGSALLYATLYMTGCGISVDDLKKFRKYESITPGHPEISTPFVDASTGPLGQGFAMGVGMALGEKYLNKKFKYQKNSLINHYTYILVSDGDLMEGISYEAAAIAGNHKLNKLIVLYDSNGISLDGDIKKTLGESVTDRFKALNWNVFTLNNPYDFKEFDNLINNAKNSEKPSIIEVKTVIGEYSKNKNTNIVHGKPLDDDDIKKVKKKLGIRDVPYTVLSDAYSYMKDSVEERVKPVISKWKKDKDKILSKFSKELVSDFNDLVCDSFSFDFNGNDFSFGKDKDYTGREISNIILDRVSSKDILCLTTDTSSSTMVYLNDKTKNIQCGVREFSASAIMNGISLMNIKCITSTFLSFSNYMIPSIRMGALMKLKNIYVFTHDTILVGEDGPTHQPIEQLDQLRLIPNVTVFRPCDSNEMIGAYKYAFENSNGPVVIVVSKDILKHIAHASIAKTEQGGYVLKNTENASVCLVASGSEVRVALEIRKILKRHMVKSRVVSMPSIELFDELTKKEQEKILPSDMKKVAIELSTSVKYYKYFNKDDILFNVSSFGKSGSKKDILDKILYNNENIVNEIINS